MNVLPWLLDWPPHPLTVVFVLLLTVFSAGTLLLFGGVTDEAPTQKVSIEATDVTVRLNDDFRYPDLENGTVHTCLSSGTPGDHLSVLGDVIVEIPHDTDERSVLVGVSLAHTEETTAMAVDETGTQTVDVFWLLEDDETLSVGDTAELQIHVRSDGETLADATRELTVQNGSVSYDCDRSLPAPTRTGSLASVPTPNVQAT
ncbi:MULTISPECIES: hypothetical protein [Haloferax]|uniref:Uncharacterized protein n=1 Tax=Haloferax marinum TaxID=2666143 RepID=A0A6A8GBN9_9EURY|nr:MULTISPECIES: hypothetical protein [Haloferax]KAB1190777.1 hypothetical protein Hfx1150_17250 [Haloferax sp. CBA1150]MRW98317.1 hypothetical protein [Haloferax marinum]